MEPNSIQTPVVFEFTGLPKKQTLVNTIIILVVVLVLILQQWQNISKSIGLFQNNSTQTVSDLVEIVIPLIIAGLIFSLIFFIRKTHKKFSIDNQSVYVDNKSYLWSDIKNFHMLGDSQDERTGLGEVKYTGGYDVVNPYAGLGIYVLKSKGLFPKTVRLQVSPDRVPEFENILASHGILKESQKHMYLTGVNKWFILLFLVPFGLIVLVMIIGLFISR